MEPVTKEDLFNLAAEIIQHVDKSNAALKAEMIEHVDKSNADLKAEMVEHVEQVETKLLKEFRKWAIPHNARIKVFEISVHGLTERLELVEERLAELEQR